MMPSAPQRGSDNEGLSGKYAEGVGGRRVSDVKEVMALNQIESGHDEYCNIVAFEVV